MTRRVRIHEAAAEEATEAAAYYNARRAGLGERFQRAIEEALDRLQAEVVPLTALAGEPGRRGLKKLLVRGFPFSMVVQPRADDLVVVAFAHHARQPGYWRDRLDD